jgi:hypothetical protein
MTFRFVEAGPFWRWFLTRYQLAGIVMPWGKCYYLPPWHKCPEFIRHETVHFKQMERDGRVMFTIKYLYWLARYGYRANPYEIEAYGRETGNA